MLNTDTVNQLGIKNIVHSIILNSWDPCENLTITMKLMVASCSFNAVYPNSLNSNVGTTLLTGCLHKINGCCHFQDIHVAMVFNNKE